MHVRLRRLGFLLLKLAILALVVWGGYRTISQALGELQQHGWQLSRLHAGWAVAAGLLYLASQLPAGWFWHGLLAALGQIVALPRALRAYYIGHLGKYVPGKAMVVVLRAALVGQPQVKTSMAVVAVFYETFTTMEVGAALAALILAATMREHVWLIVGSLALAVLVGLPTVPAVFVRLLRLLRAAPPTLAIHIKPGLLIGGWSSIVVGWFLAGASLWAAVQSIGVSNSNLLTDLPLYTAAVALAVVLGFVSMLPAGVGVRDIALMQLLVPHFERLVPQQGELFALVAVIVLRLVWLVAEVLLAAAVYPLGRGVPVWGPGLNRNESFSPGPQTGCV